MTEDEALNAAHLGTGQYQPGEVYYQPISRTICRAVLIAGRDRENHVVGWYLPHPDEAKQLGQQAGYLIPALFSRPETELSIPDPSLSNASLKAIINRLFFPEKISGILN
ncbi:MAG TPA: hypothetical protein PLD73_15480 [Candidatus Hydrogenedentes bacterium]|nr:hypothetical protein [Candidatus Hydrogenedentota bacterium]